MYHHADSTCGSEYETSLRKIGVLKNINCARERGVCDDSSSMNVTNLVVEVREMKKLVREMKKLV